MIQFIKYTPCYKFLFQVFYFPVEKQKFGECWVSISRISLFAGVIQVNSTILLSRMTRVAIPSVDATVWEFVIEIVLRGIKWWIRCRTAYFQLYIRTLHTHQKDAVIHFVRVVFFRVFFRVLKDFACCSSFLFKHCHEFINHLWFYSTLKLIRFKLCFVIVTKKKKLPTVISILNCQLFVVEKV